LNIRDQTASGGGSGGDVNITGCEVTLPISGSVTCDISGQTVVVSGVATEATLSDTYTLLNDNIGTGGLSVSLTALDGEKISNTVVNLKRGLDVNLINSLTVDISGQRVVTDISGQTVDISGQRVVTDISGQTVDISGQTVLVDISGQTVDISGQRVIVDVSGQTVLVDISGQRVVTDISGQTVDISGQRVVTDISGQTVDISGQRVLVDISGQTVNVGNAVSVNVLDVNSTVYDFTNDSSTITQADSRFEVDRIRPDSWSFTNFKNQTGSNAFFYSNSAASPIGAQQFNILHGDLESLYFVAGINRTDDINAVPFMAVFSPSNIAFYTSRWVYTIDPSEKLIQGEKVLLYYGVDPVHIYTNLRHLQLMKNVIASQGPQLESETCYLMSINTASGLTASSVYYNLYNCGWILNDVKHTHNDYAFSSGIQSRADFLLSKLNITDGELLDCAVRNTVDVSSQSLSSMTFDTINTNDGNKQGLNVIVRNQFYPTTVTFTEDDISIDDMTPPIDVRAYNRLSVFGVSSHTGGGSHNIILMYSNDDITYYDSPNVIAATATKFAYDNSTFCVSYIKFRFQVQIETLTFNVSLK
jgi:hypothetical protein